jgi:hypothetical protein
MDEMNVSARKKLPWGKILLVLALVCGLALLYIFVSGYTTPEYSVRLADGTTLRLAKITYGKNHEFEYYSGVQRVLARLPAGLRKTFGVKLPPIFRKETSANDAIVLWFEHELVPKGNPLRVEIFLTDSGGTMNGISIPVVPNNVNTKEVSGFIFTAFPRQSKNIDVVITAWDSTATVQTEVGRFQIRNPGFSNKAPSWKAQPLPVASKSGDVEFSLTKLSTSILPEEAGAQFTTNIWNLGTVAEFEVRQQGQLLTNWQPMTVFLQDTTGNEMTNRNWYNWQKEGRQLIAFAGTLDPKETWKLRVEFSRTSGFTPEETWTFAMPTSSFTATNWCTGVFTNTLVPFELLGTTVEYRGWRMQSGSSQTTFAINTQCSINRIPPNYRFSMGSATDEEGRPFRRFMLGGSNLYYAFDLNKVPLTGTLKITMAIHPSRFVEFIAKPAKE